MAETCGNGPTGNDGSNEDEHPDATSDTVRFHM
jgi:hypothetical protein